jgi:hypothetical protein
MSADTGRIAIQFSSLLVDVVDVAKNSVIEEHEFRFRFH